MESFKPSDVKLDSGYFPGDTLACDRAILVTLLLRFLVANGDVWTFSTEAFYDAKGLKKASSNMERDFIKLWDKHCIENAGIGMSKATNELLYVLAWFLKNGKRLKPSDIDLSRGFEDSTLETKEDRKLLLNFVKYLQQNGDTWGFNVETYINNTLKADGDAVKHDYYFHPRLRLEHLMLLGGGFFIAVNGKGYYSPPFELNGSFKASAAMMHIMWKYLKK